MHTEKQTVGRKGSGWLPLGGVLASTLAAPVSSAPLEPVRQGSQSVHEQAQPRQMAPLTRLETLTRESQHLVADQLRRLQEQAQLLQLLRGQVGRAQREEAKPRDQSGEPAGKLSSQWSQRLVEPGAQATQDIVARGRQVTHDVLERAQQLVQRRGKVTQVLAKRSGHLLEPVRKQSRTSWLMVGLSVGVLATALLTYLLLRRRMAQQEGAAQEQPSERPQPANGKVASQVTAGPPAEPMRQSEDMARAVASLPLVEGGQRQRPADANYVGMVSTRCYYPVETPLEVEDLVYFSSEEEAQDQGFSAAP
jgi:hypothetical protein